MTRFLLKIYDVYLNAHTVIGIPQLRRIPASLHQGTPIEADKWCVKIKTTYGWVETVPTYDKNIAELSLRDITAWLQEFETTWEL